MGATNTPPTENPSLPRSAGKLADPKTCEVSGQVLSAEGTPVRQAGIILATNNNGACLEVKANTEPDGRFRAGLSQANIDSGGLLIARAMGYGCAWYDLKHFAPHTEINFRLVKDDIPIRGRVVDGHRLPLQDVSVRLLWIGASANGDLGPFLADIEARKDKPQTLEASCLSKLADAGTVLLSGATTDSEGRFLLRGIGRDRLAVVMLENPAITSQVVRILTCKHSVLRVPRDPSDPTATINYYDAEPEIVVQSTGTVRH